MLSDEEVWNMLGREVEVELDTGGTKRTDSIIGHLITRDPISKCLLIARLGKNGSIENIDWIPAFSARKISLKNEKKAENLLDEFEKYLENDEKGNGETEENMRERGLKIVNYLRSHHLGIVEKPDGLFIIDGTVRFAKPYHNDNFYCDIPIILKRIQKLVQECDAEK